MRNPDVELLWWAGCPSADKALAELRRVLSEVGLDPAAVRMREIRTDAEARDAGFAGSPTILIDGEDIVPGAGELEPATLTCRVYRRRDDRISPTPDPEDLREALERATSVVEMS